MEIERRILALEEVLSAGRREESDGEHYELALMGVAAALAMRDPVIVQQGLDSVEVHGSLN